MKDFEKLVKEKLEKNGINKEWMEKHLIIDTINREDIEEFKKGDKNE